MRESKQKKQTRAANIISRLKKEYPNSRCSLNYSSAHELLMATILSAQCTDQRVNLVTKDLFQKYSSPEKLETTRLKIPMKRLGTAEDCVGPIIFLSSQTMSSYITGQILEVNGGQFIS